MLRNQNKLMTTYDLDIDDFECNIKFIEMRFMTNFACIHYKCFLYLMDAQAYPFHSNIVIIYQVQYYHMISFTNLYRERFS